MRILRWPEVRALVQLSRSTITRLEQRGEFPRRVHLSRSSVGWIDAQIDGWLRQRLSEAMTAHRSDTEPAT